MTFNQSGWPQGHFYYFISLHHRPINQPFSSQFLKVYCQFPGLNDKSWWRSWTQLIIISVENSVFSIKKVVKLLRCEFWITFLIQSLSVHFTESLATGFIHFFPSGEGIVPAFTSHQCVRMSEHVRVKSSSVCTSVSELAIYTELIQTVFRGPLSLMLAQDIMISLVKSRSQDPLNRDQHRSNALRVWDQVKIIW